MPKLQVTCDQCIVVEKWTGLLDREEIAQEKGRTAFISFRQLVQQSVLQDVDWKNDIYKENLDHGKMDSCALTAVAVLVS